MVAWITGLQSSSTMISHVNQSGAIHQFGKCLSRLPPTFLWPWKRIISRLVQLGTGLKVESALFKVHLLPQHDVRNVVFALGIFIRDIKKVSGVISSQERHFRQ